MPETSNANGTASTGKRVYMTDAHHAILWRIANRERRRIGNMIELLIEEAAKARGISVETGDLWIDGDEGNAQFELAQAKAEILGSRS